MISNGRRIKEIRWDPVIFQSPCLCCGAINHGLLRQIMNKLGDYEEATYSCPVISHNTVEEMLDTELMSQKYTPDPRKLALCYHFCQQDIISAVQVIRARGAGKHMHEYQIRELEEDAIRLSGQERESWTFKKGILIEDREGVRIMDETLWKLSQ